MDSRSLEEEEEEEEEEVEVEEEEDEEERVEERVEEQKTVHPAHNKIQVRSLRKLTITVQFQYKEPIRANKLLQCTAVSAGLG